MEDAERAAQRVDELRSQTHDSVAELGFASAEEARAARLDPVEGPTLFRRGPGAQPGPPRARTRCWPSRPEVPGTGEDLTGLTARRAEAWTAASGVRAPVHLAEARVEAVNGLLRPAARGASRRWAPLRDQSLRAEAMSQLVRGMGRTTSCRCGCPPTSSPPGSTRSSPPPTSGSATCATSATSSSAPTGPRARGRRPGLGLEVVDQWTGDARDPATLSGGETFVVSLSLALGLADVVTQEAGGTEIDTLFVDEGFGTLDADTLDDVMDRLDGLRAGGRTVGVVSHVSELRNRIPTQVHVEKGRAAVAPPSSAVTGRRWSA